MEMLWIVLVVLALSNLVVVTILALVSGFVIWHRERQPSQAELLKDFADRLMAGNWQNYVGATYNWPEMIGKPREIKRGESGEEIRRGESGSTMSVKPMADSAVAFADGSDERGSEPEDKADIPKR